MVFLGPWAVGLDLSASALNFDAFLLMFDYKITSISLYDIVSERLRSLIRNQMGFARVGSNPADVVFCFCFGLFDLRVKVPSCT